MQEGQYLEFMLSQKYEFLGIIANTSMTWWASTVVFCSSIVGFTLLRPPALKKLSRKEILYLGRFLTFFFASVVGYGLLSIYCTWQIKKEISQIINILSKSFTIYHKDVDSILWGLGLGTSSFFVILIAWFITFNRLLKNEDICTEEENEAD